MRTSSTSRSLSNRGFTLVELMVTVAIIAVITGVVLTSQSSYSQSTELGDAATNAALEVRAAQVSGVSVREAKSGTGSFGYAFGVEFEVGLPDYYMFVDKGPVNGANDGTAGCNGGSSDECVEEKAVPSGLNISQICSVSVSDVETCNLGRADITFLRPDTDARFTLWDTNLSPITVSNLKAVRVKFASAQSGLTRSVTVYITGQVSTQ